MFGLICPFLPELWLIRYAMTHITRTRNEPMTNPTKTPTSSEIAALIASTLHQAVTAEVVARFRTENP